MHVHVYTSIHTFVHSELHTMQDLVANSRELPPFAAAACTLLLLHAFCCCCMRFAAAACVLLLLHALMAAGNFGIFRFQHKTRRANTCNVDLAGTRMQHTVFVAGTWEICR